jgi:hypothetical protein
MSGNNPGVWVAIKDGDDNDQEFVSASSRNCWKMN